MKIGDTITIDGDQYEVCQHTKTHCISCEYCDIQRYILGPAEMDWMDGVCSLDCSTKGIYLKLKEK